MDNVIEFRGKKVEESTNNHSEIVNDFITNQLLPWAISAGVDVHSKSFKLKGALIMTALQGMLLDDI